MIAVARPRQFTKCIFSKLEVQLQNRNSQKERQLLDSSLSFTRHLPADSNSDIPCFRPASPGAPSSGPAPAPILAPPTNAAGKPIARVTPGIVIRCRAKLSC